MELNYSTKDLLRDIHSMPEFAKQLLGKSKEYNHFLQYVLNIDLYKGGRYDPPTVKDIQQETGLKYPIIRKYLHLIYNDLVEHDENDLDFSIHEVEYCFRMHYFDNYGYLTLKNLPVIPRVGEQVEIPFFRSQVGTSYFFVDSIYHRLTDKKQIIDITLKPGTYNHYWPIRKDEAYLKGELTMHEYFLESDSQLQGKLRLDLW